MLSRIDMISSFSSSFNSYMELRLQRARSHDEILILLDAASVISSLTPKTSRRTAPVPAYGKKPKKFILNPQDNWMQITKELRDHNKLDKTTHDESTYRDIWNPFGIAS